MQCQVQVRILLVIWLSRSGRDIVDKVSKESVNYRHATGAHHCGNCVMFRLNPPDFESGACTLVKGIIEEDDVCDRWEAKVQKTEDLNMLTVRLDKMRGQLIFLLNKGEELRDIDPGTANKYFSQCWQIRVEAYPILVKLFDAEYPVTPGDFGWNVEQLVTDAMRKWLIKSEETPRLESTPFQLGPHGLWHTPSKKHPLKEKLPNYIEHVAHALMRDQGMDESRAIATAINAVKRWAKGDLHWGKGKVHPEVQQAAQRAVAEWEKLKEEHSG